MSKAQENAAFPGYTMDMNTKMTSFQEGMTLRDYFAAKAMQALINSDEWRENMGNADLTVGFSATEFTALSAYELADGMLKAREQ